MNSARAQLVGLVALVVLAACGEQVARPIERSPSLPAGEQLPVPVIDTPVVDTIGLLSPAERSALSSKLRSLRSKTGAQMAVVLIGSTGSEAIEDFAMRTAEAWQGGDAEREDGLLLTLAMTDRKVRLEVGYGLEERIPDGAAGRITDGMRDDLRAGQTAAAIDGAIEAVGRRLPRVDPSLLDGGYLVRSTSACAGAPVTWIASATALLFLFWPWPRPKKTKKRKSRSKYAKPTPPPPLPRRGSTAWITVAVAMAVVALALAWLYADLDGLVHEEALAYLVAAAVMVALGRLIDRKARKLESGMHRWFFFGPLFLLLLAVTMATTGLYLGSGDAAFFYLGALFSSVVFLPFVLGALGFEGGGGSSYSSSGSSSYSSSSYSSSSSSSSSSYSSGSSSSSGYSGGGGGFGGGGATSSW